MQRAASTRSLKAVARAQQSRMTPHQIAYGLGDWFASTDRRRPAATQRSRYCLIRHGEAGSRPDGSDHGVRRARTEHEPFEQRIAGQTIGAVDAGAGGFAGGKQARDRRAPIEIGLDATHHVVRSRAHRNPVRRQIEPGLSARLR